jgi:RND family efflux transporter MFP subunit
MSITRILLASSLIMILCFISQYAWSPSPSSAKAEANTTGAEPPVFEVTGRVGCKTGGKAIIAPVPLHPVVEVLVVQGDRVKKGQTLVKLDDDEPQADVRIKLAAFENAQTQLEEAKRHDIASQNGAAALPEVLLHQARVQRIKAERDERAAKAAWEGSKGELEHYTVTAPIDGVVAWLDVHLGMVSRPGTSVWGEIVDLSEVDVRCDLTLEQVDKVAIGQAAEIRMNKKQEVFGMGRITFVGVSADKVSGLIPVTVRVPNPNWRLRCETPVQVRFIEKSEPK